jgi:hypothetical protein
VANITSFRRLCIRNCGPAKVKKTRLNKTANLNQGNLARSVPACFDIPSFVISSTLASL